MICQPGINNPESASLIRRSATLHAAPVRYCKAIIKTPDRAKLTKRKLTINMLAHDPNAISTDLTYSATLLSAPPSWAGLPDSWDWADRDNGHDWVETRPVSITDSGHVIVEVTRPDDSAVWYSGGTTASYWWLPADATDQPTWYEDDQNGTSPNTHLFLADTGIIPDPGMEDLAEIAVETGKLCRHLCGHTPRIAMLSYSTHGSAHSASTAQMKAAAAMARQRAHQEMVEMTIDGELQVDAALVPDVAERKAKDSPLQGKADALIFPDLNSGNISLKFLQYVAGAHPFGQFILGLSRPAAQVSRVATADTILGTAAVVATQAIKYHEIYPNEFDV